VPQSNVIPLTSTSLGLDGSTVRTNAAQAAAPTAWVGLTSNDAIAGLAIMSCYNYVNTFLGLGSAAAPCALTGEATLHGALNYFQQQTWVAVGWVDTSGGPVIAHALALGAVTGGDGVKLALYYPAGGAVHFTVTQNPTTSSPVVTPFQLPIGGNFFAVFDHADALVDYSSSATVTETPGATFVTEATTNETGTPGPAPGSSDLRITQFQSGAWTTTGGVRGTFSPPAAARWTLTAPVLTTNGSTPPSGTTNVEPAFLWNDGIGNGFGDAFGVWWRH
jgi:hypothetical protein